MGDWLHFLIRPVCLVEWLKMGTGQEARSVVKGSLWRMQTQTLDFAQTRGSVTVRDTFAVGYTRVSEGGPGTTEDLDRAPQWED